MPVCVEALQHKLVPMYRCTDRRVFLVFHVEASPQNLPCEIHCLTLQHPVTHKNGYTYKRKKKRKREGDRFRGVEERGHWGGQDLMLITLDRHECFSVFHHLQKDKQRKQRHSLKLGKKRRESSKRSYYIISPRVIIKAIIIIIFVFDRMVHTDICIWYSSRESLPPTATHCNTL